MTDRPWQHAATFVALVDNDLDQAGQITTVWAKVEGTGATLGFVTLSDLIRSELGLVLVGV